MKHLERMSVERMIKGEYMMEVGRGKGRRLRLRRGNEANNLLMRRELYVPSSPGLIGGKNEVKARLRFC